MSETNQYRVTTESGAIYLLDFQEGFWKHREHQDDDWERRDDNWERLYTFRVPDNDGRITSYPWDGYWHDATEPMAGRRMYVTNGKMHGWRISTPVVTIEEVEL